jgi:hypothetical protein
MSDEERLKIYQSEKFHQFFDQSTKLIEKALDEDYDMFRDYTHDLDEDEDAYDLSIRLFFSYFVKKESCEQFEVKLGVL